MSKFIVRVLLHEPVDAEDYDKLHDEMEGRGFARMIEGEKGTYHLPDAEYYLERDITGEDSRDLAYAAAKATGKKFQVLVSVAKHVLWQNLESAT